MTGTTMFDVQSGFVAAIKTEVGAVAGVSIGYGDNPAGMKRSIRVYEAVSPDGKVTPSGFRAGRTKMNEEYTVRVKCESSGLATPELTATDVIAFGVSVENAAWTLIESHTLTGVYDLHISERGLRTDEVDGPRSTLELIFTVKARTL